MAEEAEKKPPGAASRSRNPFSLQSSSDRDNFPNFETFLRSSSSPDGPSLAMTPTPSFPSCVDGDEGDSDCANSSVLDISIGARAALAEHLRHVAKHGIDGESSLLLAPGAASLDNGDHPKSILDQQWEYLLDQRGFDTSTEVSFSRSSKRSSRFHILANTSTCLEQSIEVMTDISEDFFNSSRVHELSTPDRNRERVNFVTTRNESVVEDEDFLIDEEEREDTLAPELFLIQPSSSSEEQRIGHNQLSFQSASFDAPDISRISSNDDSEAGLLNRPTGSCFQVHRHLHLENDSHNLVPSHEADHSPLSLGGISPLGAVGLDACHHYPLDSSFASMRSIHTSFISPSPEAWAGMTASMPDPFGRETSMQKHSLSPQRSHSAPVLARPCDDSEKENYTNQSALDCRRIGSKGIKSSSAFDTLASDFLRVIERDKVIVEDGATLSPISQVGSSHIGNLLYESSSSSSRRRLGRSGTRLLKHHHGQRIVPFPPIASAMPAQDCSTSTSSSTSLTGRKRYRTVVPPRVYMGSPSQFPDEHDSFGNRSSKSSGSTTGNDSRAHRSLLDSFEAVVEVGDEGGAQISHVAPHSR